MASKDKYIIKNCPSCRYTPKRYIDGIDYVCWNAQNFNSSVRGLCQDCTDCVLKQIVELCKYYKKHSDCGRECPSFGGFLNKLLNKLDIEEVK